MQKILFIIASLRTKSFNRQLARVAKGMLEDRANVLTLSEDQAAQLKALAEDGHRICATLKRNGGL